MPYNVLANCVVFVHFLFVLFMVTGFFVAWLGFFYRELFDRWIFRTLHLAGMLFVFITTLFRIRCPFTDWENALRARYNPEFAYSGSCIVHYVRGYIWPDINIMVLRIIVSFLAVSTVLIYIIRPPARIKDVFKNERTIS